MNRINLSESELVALAARIQRNYDYDAERGLLVNRKTGKAVKGMKQGCRPYVKLNIDFCGRRTVIGMHRAVWAWHYGHFPDRQLDHINGNPTDNRIENLREVSDSENKLNKLHDWKPNKDTGLPGIVPDGNGKYLTGMHGMFFHFHDPFEAFFHATLCGKLYKG